MSRAFVREDDQERATSLADRSVSTHRNFVTARGFAQIEAAIRTATKTRTRAQREEDHGKLAEAARDLLYWSARRASAELLDPPQTTHSVRFGSTFSIRRDDGRQETFRIVGEDEADPAAGTLSYVSPLARTLMGKSVGDKGQIGKAEIEIIAVRWRMQIIPQNQADLRFRLSASPAAPFAC